MWAYVTDSSLPGQIRSSRMRGKHSEAYSEVVSFLNSYRQVMLDSEKMKEVILHK